MCNYVHFLIYATKLDTHTMFVYIIEYWPIRIIM